MMLSLLYRALSGRAVSLNLCHDAPEDLAVSWHATVSQIVFRSLILIPSSLVAGLILRRFAIRIAKETFPSGSSLWFGLVITLLNGVVAIVLVDATLSHTACHPNSLLGFFFVIFCVWIGAYIGESFVPIVLTGSIATGKSTVAKQLASRPGPDGKTFRIVDNDGIGHQILLQKSVLVAGERDYCIGASDSVYDKIVTVFGTSILDDDGAIVRRRLGDMIFEDRNLRKKLNGITHPKIFLVMLKQLLSSSYLRKEHACADVPLLFETGTLRKLFACTIVVACSPELQLERLCKRNDDLTEEQCRNRIKSQIPVDAKVKQADVVVWNDSDLQTLHSNIEVARKKCLALIYHRGIKLSYCVLLSGMMWLYTFYNLKSG